MKKGLSKSLLVNSLQCQRRLWLQVNSPELAQVSKDAKARFQIGDQIGDIARQIYGPGTLIELPERKFDTALAQTSELVVSNKGFPIFEATFSHDGILVRVDVLRQSRGGLEIIEVKSSTSVKDYQVTDAAIQSWVMTQAGHKVKRVFLAVVDSSFVYPGDGDYRGLLREIEITDEVRALQAEIPKWVEAGRKTLVSGEPKRDIGPHCTDPFECPFYSHCEGPKVNYPVTLLPRDNKKKWLLREKGYRDLREVPEEKIKGTTHLKVWRVSKSGNPEIDKALRQYLKSLAYPRYYIDFEAYWPAIPYWPQTSPYEQVPFQWSCHNEGKEGNLTHSEFLAKGKVMPAREFIETLLDAVGTKGPIIVYSDYEKKSLTALAKRYKDLNAPITGLIDRLEDLLPLMRKYYYHPRQMGSWSIKNVLPTLSDLSYDKVGIVQDGGMATDAFGELLTLKASDPRAIELRKALLAYCKLDTKAMHEVVAKLTGRGV